MADNALALSAATLSLSQTATAYAFFLPPLREVRRAGPEDTQMVGDVRLGQVASGALSLGVGFIMSLLTDSSLPLTVSIAIGLIIAFVYEMALRKQNLFEGVAK
jgi:hypothetical protein